MKPRILAALVLALVLALVAPAAAGPLCGTGGSLAPAGFQQLTVSSTAVALTVPTDALYAVGIVESNAVNLRDDGTAPTAAIGMPYGVTSLPQMFTICGSAALSQTKLIRRSSDSIVDISYYK